MKVKGKLNKTNLILSILLVISASLLIYSIVNIKNWKKDNTLESLLKAIRKEMETSTFRNLKQPAEGTTF